MPLLDHITIRGFKSIASIEKLPLRDINIIIGPNGSGKSNFIGVFTFLHAIFADRLQEYVVKAGGADKVLNFGAKVTRNLHLHISMRQEKIQRQVDLQPTQTDELHIIGQTGYFDYSNISNSKPKANEIGFDTSRIDDSQYITEFFYSWRLYHFHDTSSTSPMKMTADVNDNRYLRHDGSNLAAFLYLLSKKHAESYSLIRRTVQLMAPFFDDFTLEPQKLNPEKIRLEWRHKDSDAYFDASSLSDGTLRFIALATLFLQPLEMRPSVILVDEPELGLHPYAITLLASFIKQASIQTQVIASTQSPLLLDHFDPEDVLVADRVNGGTQMTRLDSTKLQQWLKDYSLGQLWEKNELGGRPGGE